MARFRGVVGLTPVRSDLGLALRAGVEDPVDHEQKTSLDVDRPRAWRRRVHAGGDRTPVYAGSGSGTMPAAMVAKVRRISGQFRTMTL